MISEYQLVPSTTLPRPQQEAECVYVYVLPPIVSLLSGLPSLRLLSLCLYEPEGIDARAIWPRDLEASYPWPELQ